MSQSFRHPEILEIARREGKVTVEGLAAHFGVTLQTIRRDLTDLAEAGRLERVHGGAVLPSGTTNIGYEERRNLNAAAKAAIARACAAQVPNGISLFLNIGTTTEAVAKALRDHRNLMIVTNNLNVATTLADCRQHRITVAGGTLRHADGGLVGDLAALAIQRFKVDFAVIGCSAIDAEGDLLDFDPEEIRVSQQILASARASIVVADRTKFTRKAPVRIASLAEADHFVTDRIPSERLAQRLADAGTALHLA